MADVRSLMLWLLFLMDSATAFSINYQKEFGDDWTQAAAFVKKHHEEWRQEFDIFGVDCRVAEAIVFPELIRYSMWQDEIERAAVNGLPDETIVCRRSRTGMESFFAVEGIRLCVQPSIKQRGTPLSYSSALYHGRPVPLFGYLYSLIATASSPTFSAADKRSSPLFSHSL